MPPQDGAAARHEAREALDAELEQLRLERGEALLASEEAKEALEMAEAKEKVPPGAWGWQISSGWGSSLGWRGGGSRDGDEDHMVSSAPHLWGWKCRTNEMTVGRRWREESF